MFPEYSEYETYIGSEAVRQAFRHLVAAAATLEQYKCVPNPHGFITRNYWYRRDGVGLFAFTVNKSHLLFYFRKPLRTHPGLTVESLRSSFSKVTKQRSGEIAVYIRSLEDAKRVMAVAFDGYEDAMPLYPDEVSSEQPFVEGAVTRVMVNVYERNAAARSACIAAHGHSCGVCGFNFGERYGDYGAGFVHVHHLKPIAAIGETYKLDPVKDLRPICPNCHAMIHWSNPPLTIEELQSLLK